MDITVDEIDFSKYDAVIIPGSGGPRDGLSPINSLPEWVKKKLDLVAEKADQTMTPLVLLSAGTYHKAGPLDCNGRNFQESTAMSLYLEDRGVDMSRVVEENASYDTVGNAYFTRTMHTEIRGWCNLLVIVSEFHYQRAKLLFDWIFGLPGHQNIEYKLEYTYYPDNKLSCYQFIHARQQREKMNFEIMKIKIGKLNIANLSEFHRWMFGQHDLYRSNNRKNLVLVGRKSETDDLCLETY